MFWRLAIVFSLSLIGLLACTPQPRVVIATREGKEVAVRVEVADTPAKREMGLQYRNELGDDQGMLFLFPREEVQAFWMKNTPISLDLIFISAQRKVVGIVRRAVPFSRATLSVPSPSQFVLEIKGGLSQRHGIKIGDGVRFQNISLEEIKG